MARDPRDCSNGFTGGGRNKGRRAPSLSLRNSQATSSVNREGNIGSAVRGRNTNKAFDQSVWINPDTGQPSNSSVWVDPDTGQPFNSGGTAPSWIDPDTGQPFVPAPANQPQSADFPDNFLPGEFITVSPVPSQAAEPSSPDTISPQSLHIPNTEVRCNPTPYASFFAQHDQPKFKFLFLTRFILNPDFQDAFGGGRWNPGEMWWFVKKATRPNVSYDYEDVNMYNFRQKALRRATFDSIQLEIYDDIKDSSHSFWTTFLRVQSPVLNAQAPETLENSGMSWDQRGIEGGVSQIRSELGEQPTPEALVYSASTGALPGSMFFKQIIKRIEVYHIIDWGRKYILYDYINPRIHKIELDELTWESSEPNTINIEFEFDTFNIQMPESVQENTFDDITPDLYKIQPNLGGNAPQATQVRGIDKQNKGIARTQSQIDTLSGPNGIPDNLAWSRAMVNKDKQFQNAQEKKNINSRRKQGTNKFSQLAVLPKGLDQLGSAAAVQRRADVRARLEQINNEQQRKPDAIDYIGRPLTSVGRGILNTVGFFTGNVPPRRGDD